MDYAGTELDLFQQAVNWKSYFSRQLRPFIKGDVLEVGAGLGGTTPALVNQGVRRWTCLEPDAELATRITEAARNGALPGYCEVAVGTLAALPPSRRFDSILYIDVLEHIADDQAEFERAARLLTPGGHLLVLSPAHQWLFTPFDQAIGHHRRYDKRSLGRLSAPGLELVRLRYLDSVGMLASAGNRLLLKSSTPSRGQIMLWDRVMVPLSRLLDPALNFQLGKSILAVWQRAH